MKLFRNHVRRRKLTPRGFHINIERMEERVLMASDTVEQVNLSITAPQNQHAWPLQPGDQHVLPAERKLQGVADTVVAYGPRRTGVGADRRRLEWRWQRHRRPVA